jgi:hypothetical protein
MLVTIEWQRRNSKRIQKSMLMLKLFTFVTCAFTYLGREVYVQETHSFQKFKHLIASSDGDGTI